LSSHEKKKELKSNYKMSDLTNKNLRKSSRVHKEGCSDEEFPEALDLNPGPQFYSKNI